MLSTVPLLKAGALSSLAALSGYTDAQLALQIIEAGAKIKSALGWDVEAHHQIEQTDGTGTNRLFLRTYPVCYLQHLYIQYPGTGHVQNIDVYSTGNLIIYPERGEVVNYNPFVYQTSGYLTIFPDRTPIQIEYVSGFPVSLLAADCTAAATSLTVVQGLGFAPSTDYTIYDGAKTEVVQTATTSVAGASTLALSAPTAYAHLASETLAVTNMPSDVLTITARIVERRLASLNNPALTGLRSRMTGDPMKIVEAYGEVKDFADADVQTLLAGLNRRIGVV